MLILLTYTLAAGCFLTILKGWVGIALAILILALGAVAALDRALLRLTGSPRAIEIEPSGEARCILKNGDSSSIRALGAASVNRYWIALAMAAPTRRALLVTPGMLAPESFRLLRLWALWGRLPGVAPRQLRI
jgi:hypothetical protein